VVHDTVKKEIPWNFIGGTNIGNRQVYDIIAKVKDSFDVRTIRIEKPLRCFDPKQEE
jgi:hypothetical protein